MHSPAVVLGSPVLAAWFQGQQQCQRVFFQPGQGAGCPTGTAGLCAPAGRRCCFHKPSLGQPSGTAALSPLDRIPVGWIPAAVPPLSATSTCGAGGARRGTRLSHRSGPSPGPGRRSSPGTLLAPIHGTAGGWDGKSLLNACRAW